jgi:L-ribulose-5-phosphate 3-epimerase
MKIGYNTNGFAHHRLTDALTILGELGYQSVAITLEHNALNPFSVDPQPQLDEVKTLLQRYRMSSVLETGSRYLLDPYRKHRPTLLETEVSDRSRRMGMLLRAIEYASQLGAEAVSFWSGTPEDEEDHERCWDRLIESCKFLSQHAERKEVRLAFEPEPGMLVATMDDFTRLHDAVNHPSFGLTLDLGHLHCLGEGPIPQIIRDWRHVLWNIHLEDMRQGKHDHLMFGEGTMEFTSIAEALHEIRYVGGVHVELSRHSYDAVNIAEQALVFLRSHGFTHQRVAVMV